MAPLLCGGVASGLCSCSSRSSADAAKQEAMATAENCYRQLAEGNCEPFLSGTAGADSLPESYRQQLLASYRQFAARQQKAHGGISAVRAMRAVPDSTFLVGEPPQPLMQVFLALTFADSTREEIVVPMLFVQGRWLMK